MNTHLSLSNCLASHGGTRNARVVALKRAGFDTSFPKSSGPDSLRQKQPFLRQHFLKRLPDPQGQRSLRPSFSSSNLSPCTIRTPRLTCVSDGYPRRRLLIGSKKELLVEMFAVCVCHNAPPSVLNVMLRLVDTARQERFAEAARALLIVRIEVAGERVHRAGKVVTFCIENWS